MAAAVWRKIPAADPLKGGVVLFVEIVFVHVQELIARGVVTELAEDRLDDI